MDKKNHASSPVAKSWRRQRTSGAEELSGTVPLVREIQEKLLQKLAQRNLLSHLAIAVQETRFPQLATLQQKERSTKRTLL
jgi:hypothetical protein